MSEASIPYLAPGCYGSALMYRGDDMVCTACPFSEQCEPAHLLSLQAMRAGLGIVAPPVKTHTQRAAQAPAEVCDDPSRMTLPKKVRDLLGRLDRDCLDVVGRIKSGVNPFAGIDRYRYLQVACHMVMNMKTPVTQKLISIGLTRTMKWAPGTSDAHARMAVQALTHVGAINNNDGILSVRR